MEREARLSKGELPLWGFVLLCDADVLRVFVLSPPACLSDFFGLFFFVYVVSFWSNQF